MDLPAKIEKDFLSAYKAKETTVVAVLRMLKAAAKLRQVELMRGLTEAEWLEVITKQVKQRQDSIEQFTAGGRNDLALKEKAELDVLVTYLPAQLDDSELAAAVDAAIAQSGASGMKDMGKLMSAVMGQFKGRVDGKKLSELVKLRLSA